MCVYAFNADYFLGRPSSMPAIQFNEMLVSAVIDTDFAEQCKILAERIRDNSEYVMQQRRSRDNDDDDDGDDGQEANRLREVDGGSDDYDTGKIFKKRY